MAYFGEKPTGSVNVTSSASPGAPPYSASLRLSGFESLPDLEKKNQKYKRTIRILRFISRVVSLILNAFMIGVMSWALSKWYLTKNKVIAGDASPWGTTIKLWPTFMLLGIAAVTFCMNVVTLCAYACGVGAANKSQSATTIVGIILMGIHIITWAVAAGAFKMAETGNDLWGYTCSSTADQVQEQVKAYLDFGKLCTLQGGAWYASIIQAVTYFLTFIIIFLSLRRLSQQKKIRKIRQSMDMETGYNQNLEMDDVHNPGVGKN